jgi:hypothetical protein
MLGKQQRPVVAKNPRFAAIQVGQIKEEKAVRT